MIQLNEIEIILNVYGKQENTKIQKIPESPKIVSMETVGLDTVQFKDGVNAIFVSFLKN